MFKMLHMLHYCDIMFIELFETISEKRNQGFTISHLIS
jgi:hypothetical protein